MSGAAIVLAGVVWAIIWDVVATRRRKRKQLGAGGKTTSTGVPS